MWNGCGFILLALMITSSAQAEMSVVQLEGEYLATGYSTSEDQTAAEREACNNARRDLITYIFGAAYQVNQNSVRSFGVVEYAQDVNMNTGEVVLRSLNLDRTPGHPYRCVLHYPVSEAKLEQARLQGITPLPAHSQFSEVGLGQTLGGVLDIITVPEDVPVFIDNQRWGTTPLRLNHKLSLGPHLVRLDHPNFEVIEQQIEIGALQNARVERILKRATATLAVEADLDGVRIFIDGQDVGLAPVKQQGVAAGAKLSLKAKSDESEDLVQTLTLERNEVRTLKLTLPKKPAYVSFEVSPSDGVETQIDGDLIKQPLQRSQWLKLEAGAHTLKFTKTGYETQQIEIDLRGAERKALEKIFLEKAREKIAEPAKLEYRKPASVEPDYLKNQITIGFGYTQISYEAPAQPAGFLCCFGINLGYKRSLARFLTFGVAYHYIGGELTEDHLNDGSIGQAGSTGDRIRSYRQNEGVLELQVYLTGGWFVGALKSYSVSNEHIENMKYNQVGDGTKIGDQQHTVRQESKGLSFGYQTRTSDLTEGSAVGRYCILNVKRYEDNAQATGQTTWAVLLGLSLGY